MIQAEVYSVRVVKRTVDVPEACQECGNDFTDPSASSLLVTRLRTDGVWTFIDRSGRQPMLPSGESHHPEFDAGYRIGLSCAECGNEIAAPNIGEGAW